jgi:hypothetical protein
MGIRDIVVKNYKVQGDRVWIYGENFNEFSEVLIDGKSVDTEYMGTSGLVISLEDFQGGKELSTQQVGDDHIVLSTSNAISIAEEDTETSETGENGGTTSEKASKTEENSATTSEESSKTE